MHKSVVSYWGSSVDMLGNAWVQKVGRVFYTHAAHIFSLCFSSQKITPSYPFTDRFSPLSTKPIKTTVLYKYFYS